MNIFLIGFRCTGKTTVGRILAESMTLRFVDTDHLIEKRTEQSINDTVARKGWGYFRRLETKIMAKVCADDNQVVATGGGVILNPENTAAMNRRGTVVWLSAIPDTIVKRMAGDGNTQKSRPSLTGKAPSVEVIDVLAQRTPLYREAADIEMITDDRSQAMVAEQIIRVLQSMPNDRSRRKRGESG